MLDSPDDVPNGEVTARFRPDRAADYGAAPSDRSTRDALAPGLAHERNPEARHWDGMPAVYRLAFASMPIPGLPQKFRSGRVVISQQAGPIYTQTVYILQRPGWIPRFEKTMHRGPVEVGNGLHLTLCQLRVTIPSEEHLSSALALWRDEAIAAIAMVAAMLDERIAQQELLEDLVVFDDASMEPLVMVDTNTRVRDFQPSKAVTNAQRAGLHKLAAWTSDAQTSPHVAARWYLRAAHAGPTPDAIVYLWIALEALVPPRGKGQSSDVRGVEEALTAANADPSTWSPSIGRCAGLRAQIVHHGEEQPELLAEGYYALETAVRILLRQELDVNAESWPPEVHVSNLKRPFLALADRLKAHARVTMRMIDDEA